MSGSSFNPRPQSISEVVDYVMKKLGAQLLEINVTEEQVIDRISDAIVYFQEHHVDGTFEGYFKTKITGTELTINSGTFENLVKIGDVITCASWTAKVFDISDDFYTIKVSDVTFKEPNSAFVNGQLFYINGIEYQITSFVLGTPEIGYITIPTNTEAIVEVLTLPIANYNTPPVPGLQNYSNYTNSIFQYKGSGLGISFYLQQVKNEAMAWLTTLNPWADFNRYTNRAYLNSYDYNKNIGNWIVFKVLVAVDPEEYPEMYGDTWFLNYCTEKVRLQWGENLSKFDETALLNGVKVNGSKIADKAEARLKELEDEMYARYRVPDDFFLA